MSKKQIQNDRIEKNLKVLKLLSNNEPNIRTSVKNEPFCRHLEFLKE